MSVRTTSCIVVDCDDCGRTYKGYEDEFTVHFESLTEFVKDQDDQDDNTRWVIEGGKHLCADCACARDGHPRDGDIHNYGSGPKFWCRCGRSWPVVKAVS